MLSFMKVNKKEKYTILNSFHNDFMDKKSVTFDKLQTRKDFFLNIVFQQVAIYKGK